MNKCFALACIGSTHYARWTFCLKFENLEFARVENNFVSIVIIVKARVLKGIRFVSWLVHKIYLRNIEYFPSERRFKFCTIYVITTISPLNSALKVFAQYLFVSSY